MDKNLFPEQHKELTLEQIFSKKKKYFYKACNLVSFIVQLPVKLYVLTFQRYPMSDIEIH